MSRWAVIGASSFSGASFCDYLKQHNEHVAGFSRSSGHDVNLHLPRLVSELWEEKPEYVVNFAALNMVAASWEHYADYYQTNIIGILKLAREVAKMPFVKRWVQISTPEVYGASQMFNFLKEDSPYQPSTPYAVSRAAQDMDLMALHKTFGFPVSFTRSVNVYGPAQQAYRIIPKTVLKILRGEKLELHGGGVSRRSFIHIDDVSDSVFQVATRGRAGEVYHTSTNMQTSIRTLVGMVAAIMGVRAEEFLTDVGERPGKDMIYQLDHTKISKELGWKAKIDLSEGLRGTVEWLKTNLDTYDGEPLEYIHRR